MGINVSTHDYIDEIQYKSIDTKTLNILYFEI